MRQAGEWALPETWFDRPKAANLPRDTCANRTNKRCFPCGHGLSSRLLVPFYPKGLWPSHRDKPVREPEGWGQSQSDIQAQAPLVSKPDGPSKMGMKIPNTFLRVGRASGQQAEHACFLHMLVMCLHPRAEVIQKTPGNRPAPSLVRKTCLFREPLPSQGRGRPGSCCPVGKAGIQGTCELEGVSSPAVPQLISLWQWVCSEEDRTPSPPTAAG